MNTCVVFFNDCCVFEVYFEIFLFIQFFLFVSNILLSRDDTQNVAPGSRLYKFGSTPLLGICVYSQHFDTTPWGNLCFLLFVAARTPGNKWL